MDIGHAIPCLLVGLRKEIYHIETTINNLEIEDISPFDKALLVNAADLLSKANKCLDSIIFKVDR